MTAIEQEALLNQFYTNLEDIPLEPTNPFYYNFLEDTDDDPIAELANRIRLSQSQSVNLFTGQRGSGKSTEFRRLQGILKNKGCEVFLLDMQEYMNLTAPVEISDFLIAIMTALSDEVEQRFNNAPQQRGYLERLGDFLHSEIKLNEVEISGIKASLKEDPSFKQQLQNRMQGHIARIVKDAHGFAQHVVELIREETEDNNKKIVVLVDSVEKLRGVGAEGADAVYKSVENLFSGFASSLQIPMLHIVYTIPPYLTPLAPGLGRQLGAQLGCTLPCVHVRTRENGTDDDGLQIMREFVKRRCPQSWGVFFHPEQLDKLAKASGGDLREFFRLIRDSLGKASIKSIYPILDSVIDRTLNHARREMLPIAQKDKNWLIEINDSKDAKLDDIADLPTLARFFDSKLVLNYRNGDDWYDVHPLLRDEIRK
jgi:energy-coupling factor transporter ATP-binding protein EcfA2